MPDWPLRGDGQRLLGGTALGAVATSTTGRSITCGFNADGATVQVFSATALAFPASGLLISVWNTVGLGCMLQLSFGFSNPVTGANALIPQLMVQPTKSPNGYATVYFPIAIPPLTALNVMGRSTTAIGQIVSVSVMAVGVGALPSSPLSTVTCYPVGTGDNPGALLTPTTNNVKSAKVALGTTVLPISELVLAFGANAISTSNTFRYLVNIYADGQLILEGIPLQRNTTSTDVNPKYVGPLPVSIPTGAVLEADIQSSPNAAPTVRIMLYGIS